MSLKLFLSQIKAERFPSTSEAADLIKKEKEDT